MFVIGALPALLVFPLRSSLPESPRYLLEAGEVSEAERIVDAIEREAGASAPSTPSSPALAPRVHRSAALLGFIWFACYYVNYGLTG